MTEETVAEQQVTEKISTANAQARRKKEDSKPVHRTALAAHESRKEDVPVLPSPCPDIVKRLGGELHSNVQVGKDVASALAAWRYWHDTDAAQPDRLVVHVSRMYPIAEPKQDDEARTEKIYGFPEYEWSDDIGNLSSYILQRWGSGNYKLLFKDSIIGGTPLFTWRLNGIWDWNYLPKMDPSRVLQGAPLNQAILPGLRERGFFGSEQQQQQKAGTTVNEVTPLANAPLAAAINGIVALAKDNRANAPDASVIADSVSRSYEKVNTYLMDTIKMTRENEVKGKDPQSHVREVIDLAKAIQPAQIDVSGMMKETLRAQELAQARVDKLADEMREQSRERMAALERQLEKASNKPPEDPLASMRNGFAFIKEAKELFSPAISDDDDGPKKSGYDSPWLKIAETLMPALTPLVGLAVQGLVKYVGNSPPQQQQFQQQQPGMVQQPQQIAQTQQEQPVNQEYILWGYIKGKMQHDYQAGKTGIDFACWFLDQNHLGLNQTTYAQIAGLGRDAVLTSMMTYAPEVWEQVKGADGKPQPAFEVFLADFLDQQSVAQARSGGVPPITEEEPARTPEVVMEELPRVKRMRTVPKGGAA